MISEDAFRMILAASGDYYLDFHSVHENVLPSEKRLI
jgi:hypothetical protein